MANASTEFRKKVFLAAQKIPRGKVSTYALVAKAIGHPKAYRAVGNALNKNCSSDVPCHRVVRSDGRIGGFARGTEKKAEILRAEGVKVEYRKVENLKGILFIEF